MANLTSIILFQGESQVLNAIESVLFSTEIIILHDCTSGEDNLKILKKYNDRIKIIHQKMSSFSNQRNFGITHAKNEWIFFLDSDEVVSKKLENIILKSLNSKKYDGYMLRRIDFMWGKKISKGELLNIYLLRLAKKGFGKWSGMVHETWVGKGRVGKITEPILHSPHQSISEFLYEINKYTSIRSEELVEEKSKTNVMTILFYPLSKFVLNYFFKLGFLEGNRGFIILMMMSFHSFLVRSKTFDLAHKNKSKIVS